MRGFHPAPHVVIVQRIRRHGADRVPTQPRHAAAQGVPRAKRPARTFLDVDNDAGAGAARPIPRRCRQRAVCDLRWRACSETPSNQAARRLSRVRARLGHARDLIVVGAGPAGWRPPSTPRPRGSTCWCWRRRLPAARPAPAEHRKLPRFSDRNLRAALAGRALAQAEKFGAEIAIARTATRFDCDAPPTSRSRSGRRCARAPSSSPPACNIASCPCLTSPLRGRRHLLRRYPVEAKLCCGKEVIVVGGGNSAGQAALFLSRSARHVHMLVRRAGLRNSCRATHPPHRGDPISPCTHTRNRGT